MYHQSPGKQFTSRKAVEMEDGRLGSEKVKGMRIAIQTRTFIENKCPYTPATANPPSPFASPLSLFLLCVECLCLCRRGMDSIIQPTPSRPRQKSSNSGPPLVNGRALLHLISSLSSSSSTIVLRSWWHRGASGLWKWRWRWALIAARNHPHPSAYQPPRSDENDTKLYEAPWPAPTSSTWDGRSVVHIGKTKPSQKCGVARDLAKTQTGASLLRR
ncbi:hypothetical protein R3P38DRAFT_2932639 [Favolaschia claudopus]|uniref:Uncharacterized protein n=1 Tax=Favolaschia claudopus TaxID=2862362 RepID=A0AAW0BXF7_9AGAR